MQGTAARTLLRTCREKDLDLGIGKDDRADVTTFHDDVVMRGDAALLLDERRAYRGNGRDGADRLVNGGRANRVRHIVAVKGNPGGYGVSRLVREHDGNVTCNGGEGTLIVEGNAVLERVPRDATVHGARVEIVKPEHAGHLLGDGRFTGTRGSVDGNYHGNLRSSSDVKPV